MVYGYDTALRGQKKLIATEDGSRTLFSCEFGEAYHSDKDGALRESLQKHVIPAFTLHEGKKELRILDICFGLGYNTLATLHYAAKHYPDVRLHIVSPEFDEALVCSLKDFNEFDELQPVIKAVSENFHYEDERYTIEVVMSDARTLLHKEATSQPSDFSFDIVYQDAFSPRKNPLLWTREWFADMRRVCKDDTVVTTYSTAAATRMGLYENGFWLYEYQGEDVRKSMIASPTPIVSSVLSLIPVDMAHKIAANPHARSLRDDEFVQ